jgi:nitroreductase
MKDLELGNLLKTRHSGRVYDWERDLPLKELQPLIEAAHLSPSCYNEQPWHYIITHKSETPDGYKKIYDSIVEVNQNWAKNAPILIAVVAKNFYRKNGKPNRHGIYDTGASATAFAIQAANLGYMAHQMGGFDEKKLSASFNIPEGFTPMAVMALGYEKEGEPIPSKEREELKDHFYFGEWNSKNIYG